LYDEALDISSSMEHMLDVSEEEIPEDALDRLKIRIRALRKEIGKLCASAHEGRILRDGALVVLAGAPNAGKSSLMNALLGEARAIVSDQAGTTRDSIEEGLDIDGWPIRLTDTAGLRETDDKVEAEGVVRSEDLVARADLVIALDCDFKGALKVHAKCDLDPSPAAFSGNGEMLKVSAKTGEGLEELKRRIVRRLESLTAKSSEEVGDATVRQRDLLERADFALKEVCEAGVMDPVLAANALRTAAERIGEIVGKTYSDDILEALFLRFCVGK
jgi:tRNA modification GTPase